MSGSVAAASLTLLALAAPPQVFVVASSNKPAAEGFTAKVVSAVEQSLAAHEVSNIAAAGKALDAMKAHGLTNPAACDGKVPCLVKLAEAMGPDAIVVGVDVTKIVKSLALHADAVDAKGEMIATLDLATPIDGWLRQLSAPLELFSGIVAKNLAARGAPKIAAVVDNAHPLEPETPVEPPVLPLVAAPEPGHPQVVPWLATATAVAASGGSLAFFLSSNTATARYKASLQTLGMSTGSTLTLEEVQRIQGAASLRADLSVACLVVAAGLAVIAIVLFIER